MGAVVLKAKMNASFNRLNVTLMFMKYCTCVYRLFNIFNRSIHFDMNQFVINTNLYKLMSCPYYIERCYVYNIFTIFL